MGPGSRSLAQIGDTLSCPFQLGEKQMKTSGLLWAAVLLGVFPVTQTAQSQTQIPVDSKATYLRTHNDVNTIDAIPIQLASLGISAGDNVNVQTLGDFSFCYPTGCPEIQVPACGVFSANRTLLPATELHRVPGAIAVTGPVSACQTSPTLSGQINTDISEDFVLDGGNVRVPNGAKYLFVAVADSYYSDNADSNADLAVTVGRALAPTHLSIMYRLLVGDGTDRMTSGDPAEVDQFPSEGQLYYVAADSQTPRTTTLNRFNNGPDHRDSPLTDIAGYWLEGPLAFAWASNVQPGLKPMVEGYNAATGDYALMQPGEHLPGYISTPLNVFGYPRFLNQKESILSLTAGGVKIESNRVFGGALWRWTWNGKQFLSNADSQRGSYDVLFMNSYTDYINENGDDCLNHAPIVKAVNNGPTQITVSVPLANSIAYEPQDPCHHPVIWEDVQIGKQITLNFEGMGPVARYTTTVSLPAAVPAVDFYHPISSLGAEFNRYFFYDAETAHLEEHFISDACEDGHGFSPNFGGVILSDASGQFAMGAYAVNVSQGGSVTGMGLLRHVCGDETWSRIDVIRSGNIPAGASSYNSYFMTGTVDQVRDYMAALFQKGVK
jgi:hypothetical protein